MGESCGIHHRGEVSESWAELTAWIFLPADGRKTGGGLWFRGEDAKATFPVAIGRDLEVAPAENTETGSGGWVESAQIG